MLHAACTCGAMLVTIGLAVLVPAQCTQSQCTELICALICAAPLHAECKPLLPSAGINLPPLDVAAPHYGGAWGSAASLVFVDLFKVSAPEGAAAVKQRQRQQQQQQQQQQQDHTASCKAHEALLAA
jgi:hypothetical protein